MLVQIFSPLLSQSSIGPNTQLRLYDKLYLNIRPYLLNLKIEININSDIENVFYSMQSFIFQSTHEYNVTTCQIQ